MIYLSSLMPVPGPYHARIAQGHIGLHNLILNNILPVRPHDLSEKSALIGKSLQGFYHNSWQHHMTSSSSCFFSSRRPFFLAFAMLSSADYSGFL
jgi:hypothetical protein